MRAVAVTFLGPLISAVLLTGCGEKSEEASGAGSGKQADETSVAPGSPPSASPGTGGDDQIGDWDVEVFSVAAGAQLAAVKDYLKGKEESPPFGQATSGGLTGFTDPTLLKTGTFRVEEATLPGTGSESLAMALPALRGRFESGAVTLAEIKIVRVQLEEQLATTELYVHLADATLQVNAVWEARWTTHEEPTLVALDTKSYEECRLQSPGRLVDATGSVLGKIAESEQLSRGMDHWVSRIETLLGIEVGGWHGVSVADVNGDGLDDVYLNDGGGLVNRLLVHQSDGTVRDQTRAAGLDFLDHSFGSLFADFDNDGDQDAALAMTYGVLILRNDGTGRFTPAGAKTFPAAVPYSLSAADYDQDGDLDLFAACYVQRANASRHSFVARPVPYHDAINGGRNELLRNEGSLRFRVVTKAAGMHPGNSKYSYSGTWDDYDGDGDLDLYVANDFGSNHLYRNRLRESDQATFEDVAESAGVRDIAAGMSACWGDYNNDGLTDLYVGNMFSSAGNRIAFQDQFKPGRDEETRALYQRHARGNSLFRNAGAGTFEDVSIESGSTMGRWAWSSLFADINNDGWEDLLVTNGFITQTDPEDL